MGRDNFIFYRSYFEAIEGLPNKEQLKLYKAIANYALNGIEDEELTKTARTIFQVIKPFLKEKGSKSKPQQDENEPLVELPGIEFVKLTQTQKTNLLNKYGEELFEQAVHILDSWLARGSKKAKEYLNNNSHYGFFRADGWLINRAKEERDNAAQVTRPNWSI